MHKKLFIPGPIEVKEDILRKMAMPMIGHRSKEASNLQRDISNNLRKLFFTENEILLSSSSGSGLMEAAALSFVQHLTAASIKPLPDEVDNKISFSVKNNFLRLFEMSL